MTISSPSLDFFRLADEQGGELRIDMKPDIADAVTLATATRLRMQINAARVKARKLSMGVYRPGDPSYNTTPWDSYVVSLRQEGKRHFLLISKALTFADVVLSNPVTGEKVETPELTYSPGQSVDKLNAELSLGRPLTADHEASSIDLEDLL